MTRREFADDDRLIGFMHEIDALIENVRDRQRERRQRLTLAELAAVERALRDYRSLSALGTPKTYREGGNR